MIWFALAAAADGPAIGTSHITVGNRLDSDGVGAAGGVMESVVLGGDGGTYGTTVAARYGHRRAVFSAYVQKVLGKRRDVTVLINWQPRDMLRLVRAGRAVYLYCFVPHLARALELRKEGPLYRVAGARRSPASLPSSSGSR